MKQKTGISAGVWAETRNLLAGRLRWIFSGMTQ